MLNNPRHERFAQLLAQLHGEMTVTDAHEQAGYKRNDGNASTLAQHPDVQARVKEIKGRAAAKAKVTAESLVEMARTTYDHAMESKQFGAANGSIREMGVLTGHRIERAEIGQPGEFDHLSDEELLAAIRERVRALSLTLDAGSDTPALISADTSERPAGK